MRHPQLEASRVRGNVALDQVLGSVWRGTGPAAMTPSLPGSSAPAWPKAWWLDLWRLKAAIDAAAARPDDAAVVEAAVVRFLPGPTGRLTCGGA